MSTTTAFFIGERSLLIQCAEQYRSQGHQVSGVISDEPSVVSWARGEGIPVVSSTTDWSVFLGKEEFDYLFSVGNLRLIPADLLALPKKRAVNFHDGPLPKHAGVNVTTWALIEGESSHGVTWHEMTVEPDRGGILEQELLEISPQDTSFSLNTKCYGAGIESFARIVSAITDDSLEESPQDFSQRSYHGYFARPFAAASLPVRSDSASVERLVRALDFGEGYENPMGCPKIRLGTEVILVGAVEVTSAASSTPGRVMAIGSEGLTVSTADHDVRLSQLRLPCGAPISAEEAARLGGIEAGYQLDLDDEQQSRLDKAYHSAAKSEEFWARRLGRPLSLDLPYVDTGSVDSGARETLAQKLNSDAGASRDDIVSTLALYLARLGSSDVGVFDLPMEPAEWGESSEFSSYFSRGVPLRVELNDSISVQDAKAVVRDAVKQALAKGPVSRDLGLRYPSVAGGGRPSIAISVDRDEVSKPSAALTIRVNSTTNELTWVFDPAAVSTDDVTLMQSQFSRFATEVASAGDKALFDISLLSDEGRQRLLEEWNNTAIDYPRERCMHQLFEDKVAEAGDAVALVHEGTELSYSELNARANRLARHLVTLGIGPDQLVGVCTRRSPNMIVAVMAVLKAGGAYVPLDPSYPRDRLSLMASDAQISVLLTEDAIADVVEYDGAQVVRMDSDSAAFESQDDSNLDAAVTPAHLAYVIYTSGSTGRPKGVMVEHRNAVNFFAGMDEYIPHENPGRWLSVTSLSFDISVLEIFWTLARGFTIVLYGGEDRQYGSESGAAATPAARTATSKETQFSLFYFASEDQGGPEAYRLLLEGAQFADANGFEAIWTPERHFHAFGGLYPNAAVTSAAIAATTKNVKIRAGSCVVVLHSPIRVAEEWSLVDNLSNGRVGISFASGWQPNDFVLQPDNFENRFELMYEHIETVHKLWRGEGVVFKDGVGQDFEVKTMPRPVQETLPTWVTAAGNPETFRRAGATGSNILTHLLGQSLDDLKEKVQIYRTAWKEAGHDGEGTVTLMLHTFVGEDDDVVRETVREPMKDYLRSSVGLIQKAAWSFPAFKQQTTNADGKFSLDQLSGDELEAVLDFSFERYYETSGLFGTVETCCDIVERTSALGVDEIACLVDFGVDAQMALDHLPLLDEVRRRSNGGVSSSSAKEPVAALESVASSTIGELIERHDITHFQCTPSMASMLLASSDDRAALGKVQHMYVGGEAMSSTLAGQLLEALDGGDLFNMYGPTETTIWSSVQKVEKTDGPISIGRPIANTQVYILDSRHQPTAEGVAGELCIGGDGVVRGYLNREELTADRFVQDPFSSTPGARVYRTGDLAKFAADGSLDFLGRMDHQVKVRGYRIELGEIESLMADHANVQEAVVIAREDTPGDKRLVGYFLAEGSAPSNDDLRTLLRESLPDFMIPSVFVEVHEWPLTPNLKIDRKALPAPVSKKPAGKSSAAAMPATASKMEQDIAEIWKILLQVDAVGLDDNFFDLGGHSLLTVQVHSKLKEEMDVELSLVDLFRFPTVRTLAQHVDKAAGNDASADQSSSRGRDRRESLMRRRRRARG